MDSRCIILDIGGVLEITPPTGWERKWEQQLGLSAGDMERRLGDVWAAGNIGSVTEHEVRAHVSSALGLDTAQLVAFMADLWAEYLGTPNTELITYVQDLRSRCRLGILSNSFVGAREREEGLYRFHELVEQIVYSHEIGLCKPDPRAYELTCDRLGVSPEDCLFLDDVAENIDAAREAGMQGHLFVDNAEAMVRMESHLGG